MPYWNPSKELRRKAEAKALAVSLYQPEGVTNRFFVEAPQKIFAHLLTLSLIHIFLIEPVFEVKHVAA